MNKLFSRRQFLSRSLITASGGILAACSHAPQKKTVMMTDHSHTETPSTVATRPQFSKNDSSNHTLHLFASSGYVEDPARIETGLNHLIQAGFNISNQQAAYRRYQRFAGTDAQRIADFQDIVQGRIATPKILMGVRGGYGAARLLPHINWNDLGAKMREQESLLLGFSDVTAIQLALLAQGNMPSFAGPMLHSDFSKPNPSVYTMDSFVRTITQKQITISVHEPQPHTIKTQGIMWGGNLSVLTSLIGSPYFPNIKGGLLFLEDVSEQPYRIERMLYTLHLSGILKQQQAIILGDFRMGNISDSYDSNYQLDTVIKNISRATGVPVLTGFPFGHITNKITFPLGTMATITSNTSGGYHITFQDYPTIDGTSLNLNTLLFKTTFNPISAT